MVKARIFGTRVKRLRKEMRRRNIDASLFLSLAPVYDSSVEYLTGYRQERGYAFSCLLIKHDASMLLVSPLEYEQACEKACVDEVIKLDKRRLSEELKPLLKGVRTIGVSERLFPLKLAKSLRGKRFVDVEKTMLEIRSVKDESEIELIKKACGITNYCLRALEQEIIPGKKEVEIAMFLQRVMKEKGAECEAFPIIVAGGKRSGLIHPYPAASNNAFFHGIIDFGVRYEGYCTDVTVACLSEGNAEQKRAAEVIENVHRAVREAAKPGIACRTLFEIYERISEAHGYEVKHALGHGIGLDVHEMPNLSPREEQKLRANMVFTVEPGYYFKNFGVRLENDFILTARGIKPLTKASFLVL